MAFVVVKFVEDLIVHMCSSNHIKPFNEELVSAKYYGSYYEAVILAKGCKYENYIALKISALFSYSSHENW